MVLELEQEMTCMDRADQEKELASTFINICSIYSGMGKYAFSMIKFVFPDTK